MAETRYVRPSARDKQPAMPNQPYNEGDDEDGEDGDGTGALPKPTQKQASGAQGMDGVELGEEDKLKPEESEWKVYLAPIGHEYYHNSRTGKHSCICSAGESGILLLWSVVQQKDLRLC